MIILSRTLEQTPTYGQILAKMSVAGGKRWQSWRDRSPKRTRQSSFGHGFLRKPVKAVMLSLSSDNITKYRQRIYSHQLATQSGLQMITLCLQIQDTTSTQKVDTSLIKLGS